MSTPLIYNMSTPLITRNITTGGGYWDVLGNWYPCTVYYPPVNEEPKVCSARVHVFPCLHCGKCQCGKLELDKK